MGTALDKIFSACKKGGGEMEYIVAAIVLLVVMIPLVIILGAVTLIVLFGLWPLVILGWGMGLDSDALRILGIIASLIWYPLLYKWWVES